MRVEERIRGAHAGTGMVNSLALAHWSGLARSEMISLSFLSAFILAKMLCIFAAWTSFVSEKYDLDIYILSLPTILKRVPAVILPLALSGYMYNREAAVWPLSGWYTQRIGSQNHNERARAPIRGRGAV